MDYQAEATHWRQEAETLRERNRLLTDDLAGVRRDLAAAQSRTLILESALRSVARTALNYVDVSPKVGG
jgi:hypothetical protein